VTGETAATSSTYLYKGEVNLETMVVTYGTDLGTAWAGENTYTGVDCVTAVAS